MAEKERSLISTRIRQALAAAKARGVTQGSPKLAKARASAVASIKAGADQHAANILPIIREAQKASGPSSTISTRMPFSFFLPRQPTLKAGLRWSFDRRAR